MKCSLVSVSVAQGPWGVVGCIWQIKHLPTSQIRLIYMPDRRARRPSVPSTQKDNRRPTTRLQLLSRMKRMETGLDEPKQ